MAYRQVDPAFIRHSRTGRHKATSLAGIKVVAQLSCVLL